MSDSLSETSEQPLGWHEPTTPNVWREPATPQESSGWRVPALPTDLGEEPDEDGTWHRPSLDDTSFTPDDEVEISERPEDIVLKSSSAPASSPAASQAPLAPEDLLFFIEHEAEDDFDTVGMSELVALASLAEEAPKMEVIAGADSPIIAELSTISEESEEIDSDILSPAERIMMNAAETLQEEAIEDGALDPAEYARQQMAQLGGTAAIPPAPAAEQAPPSEIDTSDPAEYARQQMAQLSGGAAPSPMTAGEMTPIPLSTEPIMSPRQQELARQFTEAQDQIRSLRAMMQAGRMSAADFEAQLRDRMIVDDDQVWWTMGVNDDAWYKSENNNWVQAVPDVLLLQSDVDGGLSLPRIPQQLPQATSGQFTPSSEGIRLDDNFMPLPQEVPLTDPNYTVPSAGVIQQLGAEQPPDSYSAPTVPMDSYDSHSQPTMMAEPVAYGALEEVPYGTIESPYSDEVPEYDLEQDAPYYEEARERRQRSTQQKLIFAAIAGFVLILLAIAGFIALSLFWYQGIVGEWDEQIASLADFSPEFQTVTILDANGIEIATLSREGDDRRPVELEQISPYMIHAAIALENKHFYDDPGWDLLAIMRAFVQNYTSGEIESGASTITQQVARHMVLQSTETTVDRKINEVVVAGELTRRYSKNEILYHYLNNVAYFGNQTYGVEAAAHFYFQKTAAQLTYPEAAMLAAIIQSPANNEPVNNEETSKYLMKIVMQTMVEVGCLQFEHAPYDQQPFCVTQEYLDSDEVFNQLIEVEDQKFFPREYGVRYPHFTQLVQAQLEVLLGTTEIYSGGYVVTTTLDSTLQDSAQQALAQRVTETSVNGVNAGSVMVTDPRNGAILAMIGSPDFTRADVAGQVDFGRTYQQPGSSIKPVVFAAALQGVDFNGNGVIEAGEYYTPGTILWDVETHYANGYVPVNYDGRYHGPASLRHALQNSYNVTAIKTYEFIGETSFRQTAEAMGLRFTGDALFNITSAVGSTEVRLYDMMAAYGTLSNDGVRMPLYAIQSITDKDGFPVGTEAREPVQALSPQVAFLMQSILSDDTARAEQFGMNSSLTMFGWARDVIAAKSGTTDDQRDLWTMGFTSNRVVGVWLGTFDDSATFNTSGSTTAAPLWNQVMIAALQGNAPEPFTLPGGGSVVNRQICSDTGAMPDQNCSQIVNEYFIASQPPPDANQNLQTTLEVDSWTGLLANDFCPGNIEVANFVNIADSSAIQWLNTQGADYAQRIGLEVPVQQVPQFACDQNTPIPIVRLTEPGGGQTVRGSIAIVGQVSAADFAWYQLEYASINDPTNFQALPTGPVTEQKPAANSRLAEWDTTMLTNGDYVLKLSVFSLSGGNLHRMVTITVNNPVAIPTPTPPVGIPTQPLPFDQLTPTPIPGMATPTVDPVG
jgi:membrane peptidoglycan carboxypeptidase